MMNDIDGDIRKVPPSSVTKPFILFALLTVLMRALNILISPEFFADGMPALLSDSISVFRSVALMVSYAVAIALVVFSVRELGKRGLFAAGACSAVIFADRLFCFLWDIARSNISLGEKKTVSDAVTWLLVDILFFALTFFASAFISNLMRSEKPSAVAGVPFKTLILSSLVLMLLELSSKLVICVQFMMEYDDVTATEYAQMAGDVVLVILKYGVLLSGAAVIAYRLICNDRRK